MIYRDNKKVDSPEELESDKESGNKTTLIPKSLLPDGVKAGDEIRLKVVHGFDDELEVEYVHSKKSKADDNVTEEPVSDEMEQADKDLDALATSPEA